MDSSTLPIPLILLGAAVVGVLIGWLIRGIDAKRRLDQLYDKLQTKLDDVSRQRDRLSAETNTLRSSLESQQAVARKFELSATRTRTELESALEKEKRMSKDLFTLREEREDFKTKMSTFQNALISVKQQAAELQSEFVKSREFYKGELTKAFEKRKALEEKVEDAKLEHESFSNLLQSSRSEHDSVNKMLASAQVRLKQLDKLEENVIKLEAENAQLNHDERLAQPAIETLQRDVAEMDELKVQNKELAQCLKSMEKSRDQYETDAKRYKQHAGQSEKKSETLRIKLDEVEQNFLDIENQQRKALKDARKAAIVPKTNGKEPEKEVDDLQEIVCIGIGVEKALHERGIFSFRQIASVLRRTSPKRSTIRRIDMRLAASSRRLRPRRV